MSDYLRGRLHRETVSPNYASTQASIAGHAAAFRSVVENLPGKPTIDLVAHSLGNIVIRHALADWERSGDPMNVLPQFRRMVMLGPPNQGALLATKLSKLWGFASIFGESGMQLGPKWQNLQDHLAVPRFPFAIVAGNMQGSRLAKNPLLEGENDLVVRVEETHLTGAATEKCFPVFHSFLMNSPAIQKFVGDFLEVGCTMKKGDRRMDTAE